MEEPVYGIDKDRVAWRDIEGEITILDKEAGEFFHLNSTASRIWHLLQDGMDVNAMEKDLDERFEAPDRPLRGEITGFIGELSAKGFIKQK